MKQLNKLLILIICIYNVNCSEYKGIFKYESNHSQRNMEITNVINNKQSVKHNENNNNIQDSNNNIKEDNKTITNSNNNLYIIINNNIGIQNHNSNKNIIKNHKSIQHSNNNTLNIKYNTYNRSKSLPVMYTINNINTKQHKLSYDSAKQRKQIEYLKQALSENYYKNSYPISSPALYHDTITNAETEQSTVNFTHNNIDDYNSMISKNEICQILSTITHEKSNFDIFMKSNNLGYQNKTELLLSKYWFETWKDDWEYVKSNILNQDCKSSSCELVVARILYKIVHYFQKFIRETIKYKNNFKSINKSCLFNYIKNECINNNKFMNLNCVLHNPLEMIKNYNMTYGFYNKSENKLYASAITYMMYKNIKLLQDLLLALSNKPYGSILQLKSIINAFQPKYYNNNKVKEKLKQLIKQCNQQISNHSKKYEYNQNNIQNEKIKANNLQNKLLEKKHETSQYEYWITQKYNENEFNLKLNECRKEYNNTESDYTNTCSTILTLENNNSKLMHEIKIAKAKIIKYNSIYYALDYINNNKTEILTSELLGQVKQIRSYLEKYYNSARNLILFLSKNIQLNDDNKILLKQSYNSVKNNNTKQLSNKIGSNNISINSNKKSFNIMEDDYINTSNNKQLLNTKEVNNIIHEINQLCTEIEKQKDNIKYYIVLLKEVIKQVFDNNNSYKNKINQFV